MIHGESTKEIFDQLVVVGIQVGFQGPMEGVAVVEDLTTGTETVEPLAVSIVSFGGYEDNEEDGDVLIYSGQGGNIYQKYKQIMDQKLERGNLALEKSLRRENEVQVVRGVKDAANPTGKVYVYDGLYKIQGSWMDKGKSGRNIFQYKLVRLLGLPEAFKLWRSIQPWMEGTSTKAGVLLPNLTSGLENIPVSLVNDVDDEKGTSDFTYSQGLRPLR
ncbi:Histone-lysine N-methyltransferase, H3 lysine-9 specific suvh1 [Ancistrocladus abbreviatus]